jgi:hypothetical protein
MGNLRIQHMDNEPKAATQDTAAPAAATPVTAAAAAASRLNEVVKQLKAELISGHERRRGSNPYDSQLGRPSRDVWGIRKRA